MPPCPFLWHVVPLPARYNVGCVNATSLPDLALHTTSWLERIVHAKIEASICRTPDRSKAALRFLPFYFYACRKAIGTAPDVPGGADGLARRVRELREWLLANEPEFSAAPQKYVYVVDSSLWEAFMPRTAGRTALEFMAAWPEAARLNVLTRERWAWGEKKELAAFGEWNAYAVPYASLPAVRGRLTDRGAAGVVGARGRDVLVAAAFSSEAYPFRQHLLSDCRANRPRCRVHAIPISQHKELSAGASITRLYRRSHFTLQPPGDTCTRKAIFDSLGVGAIPVLFSDLSLSQYTPHLLPANESAWPAVIVPTEKDATARRPRAYPGLPEPLYTRQFTRLLAAIRRGGGDRELRRRLRDSYWALQWDGEPFATRLATERCDALCRVGAHLVENFKIVNS